MDTTQIWAMIALGMVIYGVIGAGIYAEAKKDGKASDDLAISYGVLWVVWLLFAILYLLYVSFRELFDGIREPFRKE